MPLSVVLLVVVLFVFAASTSFYFSLFFFLLIFFFFFFAASWVMTASAFEDDGEAKQKSIITEVGITRLKRPRFFLIEK